MIIIGYGNVPNRLFVRLFGDFNTFSNNLRIIKSIDGKLWEKEQSLWSIPINGYYNFLSKINKDNILIVNLSLQKEIETLYNKQNELIQLKNKIDGEDFECKLKIDLFPFQKIGAKFLYLCQKALLADVVGLGKTAQSIAACDKLFEDDKINLCIVVCPASLKKKWSNEIEKFSYNQSIFIGKDNKNVRKNKYNKTISDKNIKYLVLNYDLLDRDYYEIEEIFCKRMFVGVIADEIQYIKNYQTKRTKLFVKLSKFPQLKVLFGLSATYVETGLENLFSIFRAINSNLLGDNYFRFQQKYLNVDFFGRISSYKNIEDLVNLIDPFVIRREKEKVIKQLPKRIEKVYRIELSKEQKKHYEDIKAGIAEELKINDERKDKIRAADILAKISYLRQACLSAELLGGESVSTKLDTAIEIVNSIKHNSKVLLFCFFKKMIDIVGREFNKNGIKTLHIHGDNCKPNERQEYIDKFSNNDYNVLASTDILILGQDITAASYVINFDIHWNPAKMEQRNGRIDRIGQMSDSITIINLVSANTIEENIYDKILNRTKLIDYVVKRGYVSDRIEHSVQKITLKELKELL